MYIHSVWSSGDQDAVETNTGLSVDVEVAMDTEELTSFPAAAKVTDNEAISSGAPTVTTNQEVSGAVVTMEERAPGGAVANGDQTRGMEVGLQFLREAHEYLGSVGLGWCVHDGGCLLKTMVTRLRKELRVITAHPQKTREVGSSSLPLPVSPTTSPQPHPPI